MLASTLVFKGPFYERKKWEGGKGKIVNNAVIDILMDKQKKNILKYDVEGFMFDWCSNNSLNSIICLVIKNICNNMSKD